MEKAVKKERTISLNTTEAIALENAEEKKVPVTDAHVNRQPGFNQHRGYYTMLY